MAPIFPHRSDDRTRPPVPGTERCFQFTLGDRTWGMPAAEVVEVRMVPPLVDVPCPAFVSGMVNIRGTILPVVNLRDRLKVAAPPSTDRDAHLVVFRVDDGDVGMIVDRINLRLLEGVATDMSVIFPDQELPRFVPGRLFSAEETAVLRKLRESF